MKLDEYIKTRGNVDVAHEELDKLLGIKTGRQKPNIGDGYWYVNGFGNVSSRYWDDSPVDDYRYYTNNCFFTEEAAELKMRIIETEIELRKYAEEHNEAEINWTNGEQYKWYLNYDFISNCIEYTNDYSWHVPNQIYFTSFEIAQAAVNEIGKERVKEYLKYGSGVDD